MYSPPPALFSHQVCLVEQILQMGVRQEVFNKDWSIKEECKEKHVVPVIKSEVIEPNFPVRTSTRLGSGSFSSLSVVTYAPSPISVADTRS